MAAELTDLQLAVSLAVVGMGWEKYTTTHRRNSISFSKLLVCGSRSYVHVHPTNCRLALNTGYQERVRQYDVGTVHELLLLLERLECAHGR